LINIFIFVGVNIAQIRSFAIAFDKNIYLFLIFIGVLKMIRFKLKEMIAKHEFVLGKRLTLKEISVETGINRMTLTKINTVSDYSTSTDTLDKLCQFFNCKIEDLVEYVSDEGFAQLKSSINVEV
jgi:putative transcriptional regulator